MRGVVTLLLSAMIVMAFSSVWLTYQAIAAFTAQFPFLFDTNWAITFRFVLGSAATITTVCVAFYVFRVVRLRDEMKVSVSHYVRNRLQILMLHLEMLESTDYEQNLVHISHAQEACRSALKELDLIATEKLLVDDDTNKFLRTRLSSK